MTSVFIVDDHELMREGLKTVLASKKGIRVAGEAGSFREFTESFRPGSSNVVILDISLPDRNGLEVLKYIRDHHPRTQVLILSMHPEERFAVRALKGGAKGYLNKQTAGRELVTAIETIRKGGIYLSKEVASALVRQPEEKQLHETLSDREFEIFRMIASGKSPAQMSKILHVSVNTVMTHRSHVLKKMRFKTTADLVRYALEHRLID